MLICRHPRRKSVSATTYWGLDPASGVFVVKARCNILLNVLVGTA